MLQDSPQSQKNGRTESTKKVLKPNVFNKAYCIFNFLLTLFTIYHFREVVNSEKGLIQFFRLSESHAYILATQPVK